MQSPALALVLNCPTSKTDTACQTQAQITIKYNTCQLPSVTGSGGCNSVITNNSSAPPSACGEVKTVIFKIKSDCGDSLTCSRTSAVPTPTSVDAPVNKPNEAACQTQSAIDSKFTTWLNTATKSGGCNAVFNQ
ncbi:MAG: hypothetical protein U0T81_04180 [Saprospiraceae bacterium]